MNSLHFSGKKIAIMGGNGFIGTHLAKKLRMLGAKFLIIANKKNPPSRADFLQIDLLRRDSKLVRALLGCGYVFHLAATFSPKARGKRGDENYLMTKNILEASAKAGISKIVMASSAAVYPTIPRIIPIPEYIGREGSPNGVYGESKRRSEDFLLSHGKKYGIHIVIPRIFNVYGPGDLSARFVSSAIRDALTKNEIIILGDGNQTRDFIYIDDCIAGLLACMENGTAGQTVNICTGQETSLMGAAKIIVKTAKADSCRIGLETTDDRPGIRSVGDTSIAQKQLQFKAKTSLAEGIKKTLAWFQKQGYNL